MHVVAVAAAFILAVALLDGFHVGTGSGRIILSGALIAAAWTLAQARRPGLREALASLWRDGAGKVADVAPFFISMGLFSTALERSGLLEQLRPGLLSVTGFLGPASVVLVAGLMVAASMIGLHPFISIVLLGKILMSTDLPVPVLTVALGLAAGAATSYMVTPFAGVVMTIAKHLDARAIDIAFRWNWRYCAAFFALSMAFSFAWGAAFGLY